MLTYTKQDYSSQFAISSTAAGCADYTLCRHSASVMKNGKVMIFYQAIALGTIGKIYGKILDIHNNKISNEFLVSESNDETNHAPASTALDNGDVVVIWAKKNNNIIGQRFGSDGEKKLENFIIGKEQKGCVSYNVHTPNIVNISNDQFLALITCKSSDNSVRGQIFGNNNGKITDFFPIIQFGFFTEDLMTPVATKLTNGSIAVFSIASGIGGTQLYFQLVNQNGVNLGATKQIYTNGLFIDCPQITTLQDGFLLVYMEYTRYGGSNSSVYARKFDNNGLAIGDKFMIGGSNPGNKSWAVPIQLHDKSIATFFQNARDEEDYYRASNSYKILTDLSKNNEIYLQRFISNETTEDILQIGATAKMTDTEHHVQSRPLPVSIQPTGSILLTWRDYWNKAVVAKIYSTEELIQKTGNDIQNAHSSDNESTSTNSDSEGASCTFDFSNSKISGDIDIKTNGCSGCTFNFSGATILGNIKIDDTKCNGSITIDSFLLQNNSSSQETSHSKIDISTYKCINNALKSACTLQPKDSKFFANCTLNFLSKKNNDVKKNVKMIIQEIPLVNKLDEITEYFTPKEAIELCTNDDSPIAATTNSNLLELDLVVALFALT